VPEAGIPWVQTKRHPASKQRDPIQGEFFNTDSITTLAKQLTREGIGQNPLDAGLADPVRVRVHVSGDSGALTPAAARPYFRGLRDHVRACDAGAARVFDEPCRYLVIEDFNTTGLRGDPAELDPVDEAAEGNDFFYFFRAEGKSGKSGADRGRWGVGKYVFPMASHINTFFGLTIRPDGATGGTGPLLMGQAVLRNHKQGGQGYEPDGWWSEFQDEVPVPVTNLDNIGAFRTVWNVSRSAEPGLSVVIPYVRPDLGAEDLAAAILLDYYLAVLRGKLEVVVTSPELDEEIAITADGLDLVVERLRDRQEREELRKQISLALWHLTLPDSDFFQVQRISGETPRWAPDLIEEADRMKLRDTLDLGQPVAIRVPVKVERKDVETRPTWSYFDVIMVTEPGYNGKPEFVREGLIVPEVSSPRLSNLRCLVTIDDTELARMVGDAEGPAHTNWSARTHKFTGKYAYGQNWLTLIKRAPAEILRIIRAADEDADRRVMARFFPAPPATPTPPVVGGLEEEDGPRPSPTPDPDPPDPRPRRIRISRVSSGFSLHLTGHGDPVRRLRIRTAYDRRRGSAFKNWKPDDFDLSGPPIEVQITGGIVAYPAGNQLLVQVEDTGSFSLNVRGFDENRDLQVDAKVEAAE
jgi:hypothetical protein